MLSNADLCSLAESSLHENDSVSMNVTAEFAAGVLRLHKEQERRAQVFEDFLADRGVLKWLPDGWREKYYKDIPVNKTTGNQQTVNQQRRK